MKRIFISLALLALTGLITPALFANDEGGDGAYMPDYKELVREGYGPTHVVQINYDSPRFVKVVPKPTQAYYGKGFVVYYGYTPVPVWDRNATNEYAFGHPLAYFQGLMANSGRPVDLTEYAVEVRKANYQASPSYVAQRPAFRATPVTHVQSIQSSSGPTTVKAVTGVLPPIGEKPQ